jgi:gamma-glutamylcyclotransferase (GGCT)/AIG2-like uncharacterized protein YtfP
MPQYLFSYGTLDPQVAPKEIAPALEQLRRVGRGVVRGTLYHLGKYPGAILDDKAATKIKGTVFELPPNAGVLRRIDRYEGYKPGNVSRSLFVRQRREVTMAAGRKVPCWVYVYNRPLGKAAVIKDGDFRRRRFRSKRNRHLGTAAAM